MTDRTPNDRAVSPADRQSEHVVEETRIPLVEERVTFDKQEREGKTITVRTTPVSDTHTISEELVRENLEIRRVPVDRVVEAIPEIREEDGVTIMPVVEERLKVVKELVLVEEVHLARTRDVHTDTRTVELTRTDVAIDKTDPK